MESLGQLSHDAKPVLLLTEGEVLLRTEVAAYLRECGYRVIETASTDEALLVLQSDIQVNIAFVDLEAPSSKEGFNLAQWIRRTKPGVKIILTSGIQRTAKKAEGLCEHGPLLTKPYSYQILEQHLRRRLGTHARARAHQEAQ
jgi:DNA-binding response OmpR family regulator